MAITDDMRRVKLAAIQAFKGIAGIEGIGLGGASTLIVYVRDRAVAANIPRTFEDFRVETVVTGKISATAV